MLESRRGRLLSLASLSTTRVQDNPERWGDYSAVTTDPLNATDAWLVNEIEGGVIWGSQIVRFGF